MQKNTSRLSVGFLMPTIAAALVTTIALALCLTWSAQGIDLDTAQRERGLIERAMAEVINRVGYAQAHLAVWDEAVQACERGDRQWLGDYHVRAERKEADHRALHDPLTGLGHRRLFNAEQGTAGETAIASTQMPRVNRHGQAVPTLMQPFRHSHPLASL